MSDPHRSIGNIAAYTEAGLPPDGELVEFVSINGQVDGGAEVIVRNRKGVTVSVVVPAEAFYKMARALFAWRCTNQA